MPGPALKTGPVLPPAPWGALPTRLRVLLVTAPGGHPGWLHQAAAADSAVCWEIETAASGCHALNRLGQETFDAVVVEHLPPEFDAWETVAALRGSGAEEPVVVLGQLPRGEQLALACEQRADDYIELSGTTTRTFVWTLGRAIERQRLIREHRRLSQAESHRLRSEQQETERLLGEQRALVRDLERLKLDEPGPSDLGNPAEPSSEPLPVGARTALPRLDPEMAASLAEHYRELLRAYVIMGCGSLVSEMDGLAALLVAAGATAHQVLEIHLASVEELVRGLGGRSARHVMTRADLLVLDVMIHLAEGYRAPRPSAAAGLAESQTPRRTLAA